MTHDAIERNGDLFPEVFDRVAEGDTIKVTYPSGFGGEFIIGEVTDMSDERSIRFKNGGTEFVLDDFNPDDYPDGIADDKQRSIHVRRDLNPGGAVHLEGMNEPGDPTTVEVID